MIAQILAFMVVANPATYKAVRGVAGNWVSNAEGRATTAGLLLHALVFVFLAGLLARFLGSMVKTSGYKRAPLHPMGLGGGAEDSTDYMTLGGYVPSPAPPGPVFDLGAVAAPAPSGPVFDSMLAGPAENNFR